MSFFKKKNIAKFLFVLTLFTSFIGFSTHIQADEMKHSNDYRSTMSNIAEKNKKLDELINESLKHEKGYTFEEILNIPDTQFPKANVLEVKKIKDNIKNTLSSLSPEAKKKLNEKKYPLSMVYIDKSTSDSKLGKANIGGSGGSLPCVDDNGWGPYNNFTGSDCSISIALSQINAGGTEICIYEGMDTAFDTDYPYYLRYCRPDLWRNCSGLIGHNIFWHPH